MFVLQGIIARETTVSSVQTTRPVALTLRARNRCPGIGNQLVMTSLRYSCAALASSLALVLVRTKRWGAIHIVDLNTPVLSVQSALPNTSSHRKTSVHNATEAVRGFLQLSPGLFS